MTDLKEQARRLIELDAKWTPRGVDEYRFCATRHAPAIARAYLDQCEEIERLRGALGPFAEEGADLTSAFCHSGITDAENCSRCRKVLAARKALGEQDV